MDQIWIQILLQISKFCVIECLIFSIFPFVSKYLHLAKHENSHPGSEDSAFFKRWVEPVRYLFSAPDMLLKRYISGASFVVQTPERRYVFVSSEESIKELARAPEEQLSLVATADEMFQPAYTMDGVELHRLKMQHRILRVLTTNLSSLQLTFQNIVQQAISCEISKQKTFNDWTILQTFPMIKNVVGKVNIFTFYGQDYINDSKFLASAIQYPQDVALAAEVLRCTPRPLARFVSYIITRRHQASRNLTKFLTPMIEERLKATIANKYQSTKPHDYVQWTIDSFPKEESHAVEKIVKQTLALWFASLHQPALSLVFALYDVCTHPEYIKPLRQEIMENMRTSGEMNFDNMPLLDSFLKESARLNSSESISIRRKAMIPYTFSSGTHVSMGDWACVPQRALMRDPTLYPEPTTFNGYRFVRLEPGHSMDAKSKRFTDLDPLFPVWGLGKQACPGRFYALFTIKTVFTHVLHNYDIELTDKSTPRTFSWRSATVPYSNSTIRIRQRQDWETI